MSDPEYQQIADPLSEVTRAERKWALVSSTVLVGMTWGGLAPNKVEFLGIDLGPTSSSALVGIAAALTLYFFISFVVYFRADHFVAEHRLLVLERDELERFFQKATEITEGGLNRGGQLETELTKAMRRQMDENIRIRYRWEIGSVVVISLVSILGTIAWFVLNKWNS